MERNRTRLEMVIEDSLGMRKKLPNFMNFFYLPRQILCSFRCSYRKHWFTYIFNRIILQHIIVKKSDIAWRCSDRMSEWSYPKWRTDIFWPVNDLIVNTSHCTEIGAAVWCIPFCTVSQNHETHSSYLERQKWEFICPGMQAGYLRTGVGGFRILKRNFPSVTFLQQFVQLYATQLFTLWD